MIRCAHSASADAGLRASRSLLARAHACKRCLSMDAVAPSADAPAAYGRLCEKLKELSNLNSISGLLAWDELARCSHMSISIA